MVLIFPLISPIPAQASTENSEVAIVYDELNIPYKLVYDDNSLYITPLYIPKMGGGPGKYSSSSKVFKETVTRDQSVKTVKVYRIRS